MARILALDGGGQRLMPLTIGECTSADARRVIRVSALPDLVRAGLFFYFNCWTDAHQVSQNIESTEGSYWHALVHRQEPDAFNAGYWFRRVGTHPIFPQVRRFAALRNINFGLDWDPIAFTDYCYKVRPGSPEERRAQEVQLAEWQLLFDYCAR
ncbi:MAG TPA: hypothetical protein VKE70_32790 [Candidatus Solibacter sp.]|nr:hypothetical protein [Candidatus Solibacter sp.]